VYALVIPIIGHYPYEEFVHKKGLTDLTERLRVIENSLKDREWLVGTKITIADLSLGSALNSLYTFYLDEKGRKAYPNTLKWFTNLANQAAWKEV
jgi:glutathione S-transferase